MPPMYVGRDPFARGEYLRKSYASSATGEVCAWCGSHPRTLYRYVWESDGVSGARRTVFDRALPFCNFGCHRSYHG